MTKPMKNRNDMFERLIRAARRIPEDPSSPYAFEKRIMAHIQSIRPVDAGTFLGFGFVESHGALSGPDALHDLLGIAQWQCRHGHFRRTAGQ